MKKILFLIFSMSAQISLADNDQIECMRRFDDKLKSMGFGMSNYANLIGYKSLMERVNKCIAGGTCIKSDVVVGLSEMMVDEEVIKIQRQKLSIMKIYFQDNRKNFLDNNFCAVENGFTRLIEDVNRLNTMQMERFDFLIKGTVEPLLSIDGN